VSLSRVIPDPGLLHPAWLESVPPALRPPGPPSGVWWRLHERSLEALWDAPRIGSAASLTSWATLCGLPAGAMGRLLDAIVACGWPATAPFEPGTARFARTLSAEVVAGLEREAGGDAAAAWLLASARSVSRACAATLKLRFDPDLERLVLPRCQSLLTAADLRLGVGVALAVVHGFAGGLDEGPASPVRTP